jgi:gliding motility-associated-like protein
VDCPQPIPTISDFEVCLDVQGLSNPTLGANGQAVCGVNLEFTHDYIENLSLKLISPAGQEVQLLGPGLTGFSAIATPGARWNVDIIDCAATVRPHPGTGPQFSGSNNTWQVFGNYSGSYYPFVGCLSDFNAGPANGQWCLRVESNAIVTNNDRLVNFALDFCDDTGESCCYVDVPVSPVFGQDTTLCQGDPALKQFVDFSPQSEMGYLNRLVISLNDTIHSYAVDTVDLLGALPGAYEVCGVSYWLGDAISLPPAGTPTNVLKNALAAGAFCGELSASCLRYRILPALSASIIDTAICEGETLTVAGVPYTVSDSLIINLNSGGGCDSLIDLRLRVLVADTTMLRDSICEGDTFRIAGVDLTTGGDYNFAFTNQFGCDSLVELELVEFPIYEFNRDTAFCTGVGIDFDGVLVSSAGAFRQNLQSVHGCDSIINWNLIELSPTAEIRIADSVLSCARTSIALRGVAPSVPTGAVLNTLWRGPNASTASAPDWVANTAGWYYLEQTLSFRGSSCSAVDSVFIEQDSAVAGVILPDTLLLNCVVDTLLLAPQTSGGVAYTFQWTLPSSTSSDSAQVATQAGRYEVIAERTDNTCRDTATVVLVENTQVPNVSFFAPDTLTCAVDSVGLDASGSSGPNIEIEWQSSTNAVLPSIGGVAFTSIAGSYRLFVKDSLNGCVDSALVMVANDTSGLQLQLSVSDTLTCNRDSVTLTATPDEAISSLLWINPTGDTLGTSMTINVGETGIYQAIAVASLTGCSVQESIEVVSDTTRPTAFIRQPDTLRCFPPLVVLDASMSSGDNPISFRWEFTSGQVVAGSATPRLSTAGGGFYEVVVTDDVTGCSDTASVNLIEDRAPPSADAGPGGQITCSASTVSLGDPGANTSGLTYRWSTASGGLIGFPDGNLATASLEGEYVLLVTNSSTGCTARDTAIVTRDQDVPLVIIPDTTLIRCNQQFINLSGLGSSTGPDFTYQWTTSDGAISGVSDQLDITISSNGTYRLTVTDTITNCSGFAEAIVIDDCPAFVSVNSPDSINCFTGPRIILSAQGNRGPGTSVNWQARTGRIVQDGDTFTPEVEGGGWYIVEVGQQFTGTTATDSVFVAVDTVAPNARIVGGLTLSCGDVSSCAELDASPSTGMPGMTLAWTSLGGRFCGDTIGEIVRVNAAGIYEVTALNPLNGCTDQASVLVDVEPGVPVPDAGPDRVLACEQDSLLLEAFLPSQVQNRQWWWTNAAGDVLGDTGVTVLGIDTAGQYAFVIRDSISGCTAADTAIVLQQACAPNARPVASGNLDCLQDSVLLSSPPQASMRFTWEGITVPFGPMFGNQVQVTAPGEYRLVIQDSLFGLVDTAFVTVIQDIAPPQAVIALPQNLTCDRDTVMLDGRNSTGANGESLAFAWISSGMSPAPSTSVLQVQRAGAHRLEVTSNVNGCRDTATVQVIIDTLAPTAVALENGPFDCVTTSVVLDGSQSSGQGVLVYEWIGLAGQTLTVNDLSSISITERGEYELRTTDRQNGCSALDTVNVDLLDRSILNAGVDQTINCFTSSASLVGQVNRAGINVRWTSETPGCIDAPNSLSTEVTCTGAYYLSWTDSSGTCTYFDTVRVVEPTLNFQLEISGDTVINCLDSMLFFTGVSTDATVDLRWEGIGVDASNERQVTEPGQLILIGTDLAGCSDTVLQEITIDTLRPIVSTAMVDTMTCARPLVRLRASNSNGRSSLRYQWVSPAIPDTLNGANVRAREIGLYTVRATDTLNGCWDEAIVEVVQDTASPILNLVAPAGEVVDCDVVSVPLEALVSPANSTLVWNAPAGQPIDRGAAIQDAIVGGIYQVTAAHPTTGCINSALIVVRDESAPIGSYELSLSGDLGCNVDSVALLVTLPQNVEAVWTDAFGVPLPSTWVSSPGTYAISLLDTLTGCRAFDSIRVEEYVSPYSLSISGADTLDCETVEISLNAETMGVTPSGIAYRWVSPRGDTVQRSTSPTYTAGAGGLWSVVVIDPETACELVAETTIEVSGNAIQEVMLETTDASCPGDRDGSIEILAVIGGQGPFTFQLDGGEVQAVGQFGLLEGGRYTLLVADDNGCTSTQAVIIDQSAPKEIVLPTRIEASLGEELCLAFEVVGGGSPDSIQWSASNLLSCNTCESPCITALSVDDVTLEVWFGGCSIERIIRIEVMDMADAVWPNAFSPNNDGVNDELWVLPVNGRLEYCKIYDRWGSKVFESQSSDGQVLNKTWDGTLDGKSLNPAVFVVEVAGENALGEPFIVYGDVTLIK